MTPPPQCPPAHPPVPPKRECRECRLSAPVCKWLEDQGFVVYCEVPVCGGCIDVVGHRLSDGELIGIELKTCLSACVLRQAWRNQLFVHQSFAAVGSTPRLAGRENWAEKVGILQVVNGAVRVLRIPQRDSGHDAWRKQTLMSLERQDPGGVAGYPQLAGVGPAIDCLEAVRKYRSEKPEASWREMFEAIPNHYASVRSFQSSMSKAVRREGARGWAAGGVR